MAEVVIREMRMSDLPQILEIERLSFTTPWELSSFKYELEHKYSILKVAVLREASFGEERVVGYVCIRVIFDTAHILNLAVLPKLRRRGIGSRLLQNALEELKSSRPDIEFVILEVRESNIPAIRLYEKFGFNIIGKRAGYYQIPKEDAVIMGKEIKGC